MEDIEIARNTRLDNIKTIAAKAGIADDAVSYTHLTLPTT